MSIIIGSHVSFKAAEQLLGSVKQALKYKADTFMFYTGAPQNTRRNKIDINLLEEAKKLMRDNNIDINNVAAHAPYIVNLANNIDLKKYQWSINFLKEELKRCDLLGVKSLVLHPGSHVGLGEEKGIGNIINAINEVITEDTKVVICLETMAGKGTEIGKNIFELKSIIEGIKIKEKLGVCLDSCHLSDSGVELDNFDRYLDEFDKEIGIEKIKMMHINDSKNELGAAKDRHENIGLGSLGFDKIINVLYNERLMHIPKILETPFVTENDESKVRLYAPYKEEIEMIRKKEFNPNLLEDIRKNASL